MKTTYALIAAVLLTAVTAACTEEIEPIDDPQIAALADRPDVEWDDHLVEVTDKALADGVVPLDLIEPTSCSEPKVLVCHIPPGNPGNAHNICVSASAVSVHIAQHGDAVGTCAARPVEPVEPVCRGFGEECTQSSQCCSGACAWGECIDQI